MMSFIIFLEKRGKAYVSPGREGREKVSDHYRRKYNLPEYFSWWLTAQSSVSKK